MAEEQCYYRLEVFLAIRAGYGGVFPEPELICWSRVDRFAGAGKMLVVEPIEPINSSNELPRTFGAAEYTVSRERARLLAELFRSMGFPGRHLQIDDSSDAESIWWANAMLDVSLDDKSERLEFGLGPEGVCGPDAELLKEALEVLFESAAAPPRWSDLLIGKKQGEG
jgi:hypothetical protein